DPKFEHRFVQGELTPNKYPKTDDTNGQGDEYFRADPSGVPCVTKTEEQSTKGQGREHDGKHIKSRVCRFGDIVKNKVRDDHVDDSDWQHDHEQGLPRKMFNNPPGHTGSNGWCK